MKMKGDPNIIYDVMTHPNNKNKKLRTFNSLKEAGLVLAGLGINQPDWTDYILALTKDKCIVDFTKVASVGQPVKLPKMENQMKKVTKKIVKKVAKKVVNKVASKAINGSGKVTCSSRTRDLIKQGKSNAEIWPLIKKQFKLDDAKKYYPSWYRGDLNRKAVAAKTAKGKKAK